MAYVTAVRGHDAEWLLQVERDLNDRLLQKGRSQGRTPVVDTRVKSIGHVRELTAEEISEARLVVSGIAAGLEAGPATTRDVLDMLGLNARERPRTRLCQGCKQRSPSADFADRGDGQARCPRCCERRPGEPLPDDMKRCRRCKVAKPLSEYHANPSSSDGLQSRCKSCRAIQERQRVGRRDRTAKVEPGASS